MTNESILRPTESSAVAEWQRLIAANREQVERLREDSPGDDFYASVASSFRPGHRDNLEWPVIESLARPSDTWLDIGAGAGRFAVLLAGIVDRVIAVEPSPAMRANLDEAARASGNTNVTLVEERWPTDGWSADCDVSLAAHCLYDIDGITAFLDQMERHTRRTCVAVFGCQARGAHLADIFAEVHGEPMAVLPSLREFVALLGARGRRWEVTTVGSGHDRDASRPAAEAYASARRLLWLAEGSAKDAHMRELVDSRYRDADGIALPSMRPWIGIVTWSESPQEISD